MTFKLRWTTRASTQLADAAVYLEGARNGFGDVLLDEVERLAASIQFAPRRYPAMPEASGEIRRALLLRFGYWLIFEVVEDHVDILAVWHGRQTPDGWR